MPIISIGFIIQLFSDTCAKLEILIFQNVISKKEQQTTSPPNTNIKKNRNKKPTKTKTFHHHIDTPRLTKTALPRLQKQAERLLTSPGTARAGCSSRDGDLQANRAYLTSPLRQRVCPRGGYKSRLPGKPMVTTQVWYQARKLSQHHVQRV